MVSRGGESVEQRSVTGENSHLMGFALIRVFPQQRSQRQKRTFKAIHSKQMRAEVRSRGLRSAEVKGGTTTDASLTSGGGKGHLFESELVHTLPVAAPVGGSRDSIWASGSQWGGHGRVRGLRFLDPPPKKNVVFRERFHENEN